MNKSLSDLKAILEFAEEKLRYDNLTDEERDYWAGKVNEYNRKIEESIKLIVEG